MNPHFPLNGPNPDFLPDGTPRPHDAAGVPIMSQREANFHAHVSGMVARQQALAKGADPQAESAILGAAARSVQDNRCAVGGLMLHPLSIGTFLTLEKLGSAFVQANPTNNALSLTQLDVAMAAQVFMEPEDSYLLLEAGMIEQLRANAMRLSFRLDAPTLKAVNAFINAQMEEFFSDPVQEKKSTSDLSQNPELPESSPSREAPSVGGPSL